MSEETFPDAGVPDGTELTTTTADNTQVVEIIVNDLDGDGNVIGWHKEVKP